MNPHSSFIGILPVENCKELPKILRKELPYEPAISLFSIYPKNTKNIHLKRWNVIQLTICFRTQEWECKMWGYIGVTPVLKEKRSKIIFVHMFFSYRYIAHCWTMRPQVHWPKHSLYLSFGYSCLKLLCISHWAWVTLSVLVCREKSQIQP